MASSGAVYVKSACHIQMQAYSDQKVHDTTLNSIILTHVKENFFPDFVMNQAACRSQNYRMVGTRLEGKWHRRPKRKKMK